MANYANYAFLMHLLTAAVKYKYVSVEIKIIILLFVVFAAVWRSGSVVGLDQRG